MIELTGFAVQEGVELLQKLPLFSSLTFDETNRLAGIIEHRTVEPGTVLIEQHSLGDALYILQDGEVKVTRDANNDGIHEDWEELGRLGPGELVGEMSLVDDVLTSARVTATRPTRVLRMPRPEFHRLLEQDTTLALKVYKSFCRTLTERLRKTNQLLAAEHATKTGVR